MPYSTGQNVTEAVEDQKETIEERFEKNTEAVKTLTEELKKHRKSSKKQSYAITFLTIVLILQGFNVFDFLLNVIT